MLRQVFDRRGMFEGDAEQFKIISGNFSLQKSATRLRQAHFADAGLDGDLPTRGDAHQLAIARIFNQALGRPTELRIVLKNHSSVWVSRSSFIPCTPETLQGGHQNRERSTEFCPWHCRPCTAIALAKSG